MDDPLKEVRFHGTELYNTFMRLNQKVRRIKRERDRRREDVRVLKGILQSMGAFETVVDMPCGYSLMWNGDIIVVDSTLDGETEYPIETDIDFMEKAYPYLHLLLEKCVDEQDD